MATITRKSNPSVKVSLENQTFEFDFHQAVEIIQKIHPDSVPLGEGTDPAKEAIDIKSRVTLAMPSGEIHAFTPPANANEKPTLWVNFLSLAGVQGPLPTPFTEMLLERLRHRDTGFRDFLDVFNHRLASLLHRLKKRSHVGFSQVDPRETHVGKTLISLSGLDNPHLRNLLSISDRTIMSYHDLLWRRPKSAHGLVKILSSHFKTNVTIEQYQGEWVRAKDTDVTKIGSKLGQFNRLGSETIVGAKLWNQAANLTVKLGPLSWSQFCQFLPVDVKDEAGKQIIGRDYKALRDLALLYAGLDHKIKVTVSVHKLNVKPLRLNRKFGLGLNSWLTVGKPLENDGESSFWLKPECVDYTYSENIS